MDGFRLQFRAFVVRSSIDWSSEAFSCPVLVRFYTGRG